MEKDKLVLNDGTEIELETSQGISALTCNAKNKSAACALWDKFTPDNLKQVSIKNSDGLVVGNYQDMVLDHITGADYEDGSVQITFSLRRKSAEELLTERVDALEAGQQSLEAGQQIQDMGIDDLCQTVSDIIEGGKE